MATIQTDGKRNVKVDLTPMVDLNLLLITFFMFTTQLHKAKAMELTMPYEKHQSVAPTIEASALVTVVLSGENEVRILEGDFYTAINEGQALYKNWGKDMQSNMRGYVLNKQKQFKQIKDSGILPPAAQLTFVIKPDSTATTNHVVKTIDELVINQVPIYMISSLSSQESLFLTKTHF